MKPTSNFPTRITSKELAELADPSDTLAMRVILRRVNNLGQYTLSGKLRKYIFTYDARIRAHVLDVPLSCWIHSIPTGAYQDNQSIAHDIFAKRSPKDAPLIVIPIAINEGIVAFHEQPKPDEGALLFSLTAFLNEMTPPDEIQQAINIVTMQGVDEEARLSALNSHVAAVRDAMNEEDDPTPQTPPQNEEKNDTAPSSIFTPEEQDDIDNLHWKTFEKKYGMVKADFTATRKPALI